MSRPLRAVWAHPSAVLLAGQLIGVLLYPFMVGFPAGRGVLSFFSLIVLVLSR